MVQTRAPLWLIGVPAPAFYALAFLLGLLADHFAPLGRDWIRPLHPFGWLLVAVGVMVSPATAASFGVKRTTLNPAGLPTKLLTGGTFRVTRNPMYLGLAIFYVGLALVVGRVWPLLFLPAPIALLNWLVIPFEERRLHEAFGDDFSAYSRRVRRWL